MNNISFVDSELFLIVDVETTGLPTKRNAHYSETKYWPRVVQMSWGIYKKSGEEIKIEDHIIYPDQFEINVESSKIHGIYQEQALKEGKKISDILELFQKDVDSVNYIICHNVNFDINVINSEYFRLNKKLKKKNKVIICTMLGTTNLCKLPSKFNYSNFKYPKLEELFNFCFKQEMTNAHNSKYDVINLAKCFFNLINKDEIDIIKNGNQILFNINNN